MPTRRRFGLTSAIIRCPYIKPIHRTPGFTYRALLARTTIGSNAIRACMRASYRTSVELLHQRPLD